MQVRGAATAEENGSRDRLGARLTERGVRFSVVATADRLSLVLLDEHGGVHTRERLDPATDRRGTVWTIELEGLAPPVRYGWQVTDGPLLLDPYAKGVGGWRQWGVEGRPRPYSVFATESFNWQGVDRPSVRPGSRIVYELSVRAFTAHSSSGVEAPGTFRGLIEKIPYLVDLGVTTIELMPVACWDECEIERRNPITGERLRNLWGYSPISFMAPHPCLASTPERSLEEFKTLVRELHRAGLEVVLDVVFNHTGERDLEPDDPVYSWAGLAPEIYYLRDEETGAWRDLTGCGNTVRTGHPIVRDLVLDSLRFWAGECRVDGFRFDLASVLTRGSKGEVEPDPELPRRIAGDPVLRGNETPGSTGRWLVAEPWDAASLVQLGQFPSWGDWFEWNGRFRDDLRRFVRGEKATSGPLAERLAGSPDLHARFGTISRSVNYATCHDGFTLADLVAYERKRNEENGEGNRDGSDVNLSSNCGREGPTDDPEVLSCRRRRSLAFLALLLTARGTPLLRAGDELGRTQRGNNNAYCQDDETGWLDWSRGGEHRELRRHLRELVRWRRRESALHAPGFLDPDRDVLEVGEHLLMVVFRGGPEPGRDLVVVANAGRAKRSVRLPPGAWGVLYSTVEGAGAFEEEGRLVVGGEAVVLLAPSGREGRTTPPASGA